LASHAHVCRDIKAVEYSSSLCSPPRNVAAHNDWMSGIEELIAMTAN